MMQTPQDLQQFVSILRSEGEVREISVEVDPSLEAAEIHRRIIAEGGPALLFTNLKGACFPLITNLFGTKRRMELAFGTKPEAMVREIARLPEELMPPSLQKLWNKRRLLLDCLKIGMSRTANAPVLEVQDSPPGLMRLPLLKTWELDGGAFVTWPLVYTQHPETKVPNLGIYRLQRFDDQTTGFHCQIGKGAGFHLAEARRLGQALDVNVAIGGPPALTLAAAAPLPENVPELLLASLMIGKRFPLAANPFGPLPVAARAEFVLVGQVSPSELRPEGPFGDHYGYYSLQHDYPVFRCKGLLHRKNAICAATVVGKGRQEDCFIGDYIQELLAPIFPVVMPAVRDLWAYGETGYHSLAAAVVKQQRYKREALASAFRILGEGQLSLTKFLLVIEERLNLRDFKAVLEHVLGRCDFRTDLYVLANTSMDTLDYTSTRVNEGSKGIMLGIGAPIRSLPGEFTASPTSVGTVIPFCRGCLVVDGKTHKEAPALARQVAADTAFSGWPLVVIVDRAKEATRSPADFLWTTFTSFEPASDIYARSSSIVKNHIAYEPPIVIDARMKAGYPDELECDPGTRALVDRRWKDY